MGGHERLERVGCILARVKEPDGQVGQPEWLQGCRNLFPFQLVALCCIFYPLAGVILARECFLGTGQGDDGGLQSRVAYTGITGATEQQTRLRAGCVVEPRAQDGQRVRVLKVNPLEGGSPAPPPRFASVT